ncbi:conserved hypothetical protein [Ricinus communis]|uniref:Uncharacterized protein n=1 Tax=Ricinus communis TaxID=3988 RepID=B9RF51_RICCO|nr:conserved hypothetical protein [Ricinus communis]
MKGKSMFLSKAKVGCLCLLIMLSTSVFQNGVDGARCLKKVEDNKEEPKNNNQEQSYDTTGDNGFVATINREVPSSPDPLHNK